MATKNEQERLAIVETQQKEMKESLKKLDEKVENLDTKLDLLTSKLDNLTGGKRAMMWITGIIVATVGVLATMVSLAIKYIKGET